MWLYCEFTLRRELNSGDEVLKFRGKYRARLFSNGVIRHKIHHFICIGRRFERISNLEIQTICNGLFQNFSASETREVFLFCSPEIIPFSGSRGLLKKQTISLWRNVLGTSGGIWTFWFWSQVSWLFRRVRLLIEQRLMSSRKDSELNPWIFEHFLFSTPVRESLVNFDQVFPHHGFSY